MWGSLQLTLSSYTVKADREGGVPINMSVPDLGLNGFTSKRDWGRSEFMAPCVYYAFPEIEANESSEADQSNGSVSSTRNNMVSSLMLVSFLN